MTISAAMTVVDEERSQIRTRHLAVAECHKSVGSIGALRARRRERDHLEQALDESLARFGALVFDLLERGELPWFTADNEAGHAHPPEETPPTETLIAVEQQASASPSVHSHPDDVETTRAAFESSTEPHVDHRQPIAVTPAVLEVLRSKLKPSVSRDGSSDARTMTAPERRTVADLLESLGNTPTDLTTLAGQVLEFERLEAAAATLSRSASLPRAVSLQLMKWVVARTRALREAIEGQAGLDGTTRLEALFRQLVTHSATSLPGPVNGLGRHHSAAGDSWADDATRHQAAVEQLVGGGKIPTTSAREAHDELLRRAIDDMRAGLDDKARVRRLIDLVQHGVSPMDRRLVHLAAPVVDLLKDVPSLKRTRKAAMKLDDVADPEHAGNGRELLPPEWPWLSETRGLRVAIVGGEPRPKRTSRLENTFEFGHVDWIDGAANAGRQVDSLIERMKSGTVDMVIVLRAFSSHKLSERVFACDAPSCRCVLADTYGVLQVRLGIERFVAHVSSDAEREST